MLRDGIESQYDTPAEEDAPQVGARVARRKERYADAITTASHWRNRLNQQVSIEQVTF